MLGFGDLLRIDLTNETVTREEIPLAVRRKYLGGNGMNSRLLWEHFLNIDPKIDGRSPDNVLIVGLGPLGATPFGLGSKTKFTFKSPAYNLFGDSVGGSGFGPALRWAGYDHLVITGKAKCPTYLWVDDDKVELRDASHLWGKNTHETEAIIKRELKDDDVQIACIGRGGENLVGYANIVIGGHRTAGRTGGGCVMGSKNLKAMVARGTNGVPLANPTAFMASMDDVLRRLQLAPIPLERHKRFGTLQVIDWYETIGSNGYRNMQAPMMPDGAAKTINADAYRATLLEHNLTCSPGCNVSCSSWHTIRGHESEAAKHFTGEGGMRPEYLSVASVGINSDIRDLPAIIHLNTVLFEYSMDVVEAGSAVAVLRELWQRGVIDAADIKQWAGEDLDLSWGGWETSVKILSAIGDQSCELGRMFRDNTYEGAKRIGELKGVPTLKYVNYGKGHSTFTEDPRQFPMWMCNMAVSSRGCCHLKGTTTVEKTGRKEISMQWFGRPEAGDIHGVTIKGWASARAENLKCFIDSTGICHFMAARESYAFPPGESFGPAIAALTGLELTGDEMYTIGERTCNLEKAFNSRLGLTRKDDTVCERWMHEPIPAGAGKGMKAEDYLDRVLDDYYDYHGWDKVTGLQRREKLLALDLPDVADILAKEGALVE